MTDLQFALALWLGSMTVIYFFGYLLGNWRSGTTWRERRRHRRDNRARTKRARAEREERAHRLQDTRTVNQEWCERALLSRAEDFGRARVLFIDELAQRYPAVAFDFSTAEGFDARLKDMVRLEIVRSTRLLDMEDVERALTYTLHSLVHEALNAYLQAELQPTAAEVDCSLADESFWSREPLFRSTEGGVSPPDWSTRRRLVWERDSRRCRRCGLQIELKDAHIHHIVRRAHGGQHEFANLATVCRDCHTCLLDHDHMRAWRCYAVEEASAVVHSIYCKEEADYLPTKRVSLNRLLEQGWETAPCCEHKVKYLNELAHGSWEPKIKAWATQRAQEIGAATATRF